jgi:hypothetical protein
MGLFSLPFHLINVNNPRREKSRSGTVEAHILRFHLWHTDLKIRFFSSIYIIVENVYLTNQSDPNIDREIKFKSVC